jgi:EAL domain-containing protein (putative c-di-GMP-specific phosphodiesterase class I)
MSADYQEMIEDFREEDEMDEITEEYLEKIIALHKTFSKKAEDKIAETEFSEFLDFARNVSSQQYVHQNIAEDLLEVMDS